MERVTGFESEFTGAYDDQVLYMKLALQFPAFVTNEVLGKYRRHRDSIYHLSESLGRGPRDRRRFIVWLERFVRERGLGDENFASTLATQYGTAANG